MQVRSTPPQKSTASSSPHRFVSLVLTCLILGLTTLVAVVDCSKIMNFGLTNTTNLSKKDDDESRPPTVYVMSRYHHSTRLTDRNLTPPGVLKLSSGDCRDLIISKEEESSAAHQLLNDIYRAPYCKVTWGTTITRRKERISQVIHKYPQLSLQDQNKIYSATPYEEAYATAISNRVHDNVNNAMVLVAFGGSCLHVLTVNQDRYNNLLPGPNFISKGLSDTIQSELVAMDELVGTPNDWIEGHTPPLPPDGTFYTTFPLDEDLTKYTFTLIARLFQELNELITKANGTYLICGAPTLINPTDEHSGEVWWPDKSARVIQTTFHELAKYSALPQIQNNDTGIFQGGLLSDRYKINVGNSESSSTTIHEMVLSAMALPQVVIDTFASSGSLSGDDSSDDDLRGIHLAIEYFKDA